MPSLMPRLVLFAVAAAVLFTAGWTVNGWRLATEISTMRENAANAVAQNVEDARALQINQQRAIAEIDAARTKERSQAHDEINRLRARVDAGAVRLRIAARCPAPDVPGTADGPGVDHGAGAELNAAARSDYFALRDGLARQSAKLTACQDVLAKIVSR